MSILEVLEQFYNDLNKEKINDNVQVIFELDTVPVIKSYINFRVNNPDVFLEEGAYVINRAFNENIDEFTKSDKISVKFIAHELDKEEIIDYKTTDDLADDIEELAKKKKKIKAGVNVDEKKFEKTLIKLAINYIEHRAPITVKDSSYKDDNGNPWIFARDEFTANFYGPVLYKDNKEEPSVSEYKKAWNYFAKENNCSSIFDNKKFALILDLIDDDRVAIKMHIIGEG